MQQLLLFLLQANVAVVLFWLHPHPISASGSGTLLRDNAINGTLQLGSSNLTNLIENGSFEEGIFNLGPGGDVEILDNSSNPNAIAGWTLLNGSVDRGYGRWKRASDCTLACVDLSGGDRGTIAASFQAVGAETDYSIWLDAAANPDSPRSRINGTFSVTVLTAQNVTLNSSLVYVDGHGHNRHNIGWRTHAVFFKTPALRVNDNFTLSLSSNIRGWFGPLIDNIRIYEGLHFPNSEQDATCPEDVPKVFNFKLMLILATVIPLSLILSVGVFLLWRQKTSDREVKKAISLLQGRLKIFPYKVVKSSTKNFDQDRKLGEGMFGAVYKGILKDGSEVAIKQLFTTAHQGQEEFFNEAMVISTVQHRNLVSLKGCCVKGRRRFLVCEYVENKSLYQILWGRDAIYLDWPTRLRIILGTAHGLAYLHEESQPRIIHRDIKTSNILLDKNFEAKIADFGLARWFPDGKTHISTNVAGTLGYLAPEYAMRGQLSVKADVFSFGVVVLELVTGRKNLDYECVLEDQYLLDWGKQLCRKGNMRELIDPKLQEDDQTKEEIMRVIKVGLWCTQEVAAMRPTMSEALSMLQEISQKTDRPYSSIDIVDVVNSAAAGLLFDIAEDSSCSLSTLPSAIKYFSSSI